MVTLQRIFAIVFSTASFGSGFTLEIRPPKCFREQQQFFLSALKQHGETNEELMHDIEIMEYEAKNRLQNLLEQMDELEDFQKTRVGDTEDPRMNSHTDRITMTEDGDESTIIAEPPNAKEPPKQNASSISTVSRKPNTFDKSHQKETEGEIVKKKPVEIIKPRPLNLLEDTSWKIVFNIGREEGTWMPSDWGKSGARLRLELHCTFTAERVEEVSNDPFYVHSHEPVFYLSIDEAFAWPTGVGVGRKPLQIDETAGRYQVCPGNGPGGIDLLRLMIPIPQDIRKDDVTLAAGNVYGTTAYFGNPDQGRQQIIDSVQGEYDSALEEYRRVEQELAEAEHFMDWCKAKHSLWNAQQDLDEAEDRVTLASQHYPDHGRIRTDPTGKVGLAKGGGLCIKVHTGLALEYHVVGRMEVGYLKH